MPVITKEDGTVDQDKFNKLEEEIKSAQREKKMARMTEEEKTQFIQAEEEEKKKMKLVQNIGETKIGDKLPETQGPNLKDLFAKHIDQIKLEYIDEQTGLTP